MKEIIITAICGIVTTVISALLTFFTTRKRYISEVKANDVNTLKESLEFYKTLSDDTKLRLEELLAKNREFEETITQLKGKNQELSVTIEGQSAIIAELREQVLILKEHIDNLIVAQHN